MNCSEFHKQISLLLDGELKGSSKESLRLHLEECLDCRKIHEQMVALTDNVKAIRGPLEAFSMARRVKERVASERDRREEKKFLPAWGRVPLMAMILLLAIGLGNLAGRSVTELLNSNRSEASLVDYVVPYQNGSLADFVLTIGAEESSR